MFSTAPRINCALQTSRRFGSITRERVVWIRGLRRDMHKYSIKDAANLIQPSSYSYAALENIALRPSRFHAALSRHDSDPRFAPQRTYPLRSSPGFTTRAISNVVHGRCHNALSTPHAAAVSIARARTLPAESCEEWRA